jgi:hypothetical protein
MHKEVHDAPLLCRKTMNKLVSFSTASLLNWVFTAMICKS